MLPFMEVSLSLDWASVVYEVDAGPFRTAILMKTCRKARDLILQTGLDQDDTVAGIC